MKLAYFDDEEFSIPPVARRPARTSPIRMDNDAYLAVDETIPTQSAFASPPQLMNSFYFQQNLRSPSLGSMSTNSVPYGVESFCFVNNPTTAGIFQRRLEATQPSSSSIHPNPISWNQSVSPNPTYSTEYHSYDRNLTDSEQEQILEPIESDSFLDDEKSVESDHNYTVPAILKESLGLGLASDDNSIRDIGFVNSSVEFHDDLTERAYIPSESGRISNVSTPELTQNDDIDDLDSVNGIQLGYDASPGTLHFYSQAGVHITTRELQDDFAAAQSTNLAGGILHIDQAAEDEKYRANVNFFEITGPLKTTASSQELLASCSNGSIHICSPKIKRESVASEEQHLIPGIVDDLADPDYYLGPDAAAPNDSIFDRVYHARRANVDALQSAGVPRWIPPMRLGQAPFNNSSLMKRRTKRDVNGENARLQQLLPSTTFDQVPQNDAVPVTSSIPLLPSADHHSLGLARVSKTPNYGKSFLVKKRPARESFDLIELIKEREYFNKKPRLVCTPTLNSARLSPTPTSTISSSFTGSPMATALKGFTGQFELHAPQRLGQKERTTTKHVFGNHLHANGEIINLQHIADPHKATVDLSDCPGLSTTIEHANLHHTFAEEMPRSSEEDDLRREAHRECAAARLEGVPVGYYRYFAGHMTVEEYVEARLCACWEGCFCTKLCTRFGDLACPCADSLVVGEDV